MPACSHGVADDHRGGRGLRNRYPAKAGMNTWPQTRRTARGWRRRGASAGSGKGDGKLTFDKLTDPLPPAPSMKRISLASVIRRPTNICNTRCVKEFGSPCQNFCPANVYEMVDDSTQPKRQAQNSLNPSNCVHWQDCDIADPYQTSPGCTGRRRRSETTMDVEIQASESEM